MRACMFCGGKASSREDALPRWLITHLPTPDGVSVVAERGRAPARKWKASRHELKVRFVCKGCNNGWMSRLENRAKPLIESLFDAQKTKLPPVHQCTLAEWSVKTAMVFEALRSGSTWFYTDSDRRSVARGAGLPPRTRVWAASCLNLPGTYCASSDLSESPKKGRNEGAAYVTTIAFRDLALQVVTARAPRDVSAEVPITTEIRTGPWEDATLSVWPPAEQAASWPPRLGLDGESGLNVLVDRWKLTE